VAPCLSMKGEPTLHELRPTRTLENEPSILIEQVRALALAAVQQVMVPPRISGKMLQHLSKAFNALLPLLEKLPPLDRHPQLADLPFVPCVPSDDTADGGAALFSPRRAAFGAQHNNRSLNPVMGIVKQGDYAIRMIAEAAGVPKEPQVEVLAEILNSQSEETSIVADLAVTLAVELAGRLRVGEAQLQGVRVPASSGKLEPVGRVYIDDAPWSRGDILTLHPRISAEDGRLLGCTSVRAELARQCEDGGEAAEASEATDTGEAKDKTLEGDEFGPEADLVSQVKQLLQEYGEGADLVKEFIQNADDAEGGSLTFIIQAETFGTERVVDPRTAALQGASLYVCSDKPLSQQDISWMQRVGYSKKRQEFSSSGRFGVGMNVMYRYCDCPQLLANASLHFFDLTRSFVSQPGLRRGRKFSDDKLCQNFPDSIAPFETEATREFPTLPLGIAQRQVWTGYSIQLSGGAPRVGVCSCSRRQDAPFCEAPAQSRVLRRVQPHCLS